MEHEHIDDNLVALLRALDSFPGVSTRSSCGGHPDPTPMQQPTGRWRIMFDVTHNDDGWFVLEFLAWVTSHDYANSVRLYPFSAPPFLNTPGCCLSFVLDGYDGDPDELARWLDDVRERYYVGPAGRSDGET